MEIDMLVGDLEKLSGPEKKLITKLEAGGNEYIDRDM